MLDLLPAKECGSGWSMIEKPVLYNKDTLFERINGESELFFPYGFDLLAAGRYAKAGDQNIALEADIYRMGSPLDAFGIYANYRRPGEPPIRFGAGGFVTSSQLLFHQDRYFIRLQASGVLELDRQVLVECGQAISGNLPRTEGPPPELSALLVPGVGDDTARYIAKSLLGYGFFCRGIIVEAILDGDKFRIFVVPEESPEAALIAFDSYREYLKQSGRRVQAAESGEDVSLEAVDPLYANVVAQREGRYLIGAVGYKDGTKVRPLLQGIRSRLIRHTAR